MQNIKLHARDEHGYTEQIRLFLAETGMKYEETLVDEAKEKQLYEDGKLIFNKLPLLEMGDFSLCESAAILEHLAVTADERKAGRNNTYLGSNEDERSLARSLVYGANELRRQMYEFVLDGPTQDMSKFRGEILPAWLKRLNLLAVTTESDDLGLGPGVSFTFGDVAMYEALVQLRTHLGEDVLDEYRELKAYFDRCDARSRFRMHIDNRPSRSGRR